MLEMAQPTCKALRQVLVICLLYYYDRSIDVFAFHHIGSETTALLISFPIFENPDGRNGHNMSQRISFRSLYKLFIWLPHSTAEKISEGCLISTISTCMGKHHCRKCVSEVACHEDCAVKTIDWLLDAAELFGKGAAACCYLPALAMLPASYAWFIHSVLLHLDRHPTKVQIFRQETFSPCSGQAF